MAQGTAQNSKPLSSQRRSIFQRDDCSIVPHWARRLCSLFGPLFSWQPCGSSLVSEGGIAVPPLDALLKADQRQEAFAAIDTSVLLPIAGVCGACVACSEILVLLLPCPLGSWTSSYSLYSDSDSGRGPIGGFFEGVAASNEVGCAMLEDVAACCAIEGVLTVDPIWVEGGLFDDVASGCSPPGSLTGFCPGPHPAPRGLFSLTLAKACRRRITQTGCALKRC